MKEDFLNEQTCAEDILLGALGFSEEATIIEIHRTPNGYRGQARWSDGEEFPFNYSEELSELQLWALGVIERQK